MLASPDIHKHKAEFSPFFEPGQKVWVKTKENWEEWEVNWVEKGEVRLCRVIKMEGAPGWKGTDPVFYKTVGVGVLSEWQEEKEEEEKY